MSQAVQALPLTSGEHALEASAQPEWTQGLATLVDQNRSLACNLSEVSIRLTPILFQQERLRSIVLRSDAPHPIFNTSLTAFDGALVCMSRSTSLRWIRDKIYYYASSPHDTQNIIHRFDRDLTPSAPVQLDDSLLRNECPAARYGVEDCRLFEWKGELWALGAGISPGESSLSVQQILFKIEDCKVTTFHVLPSPFNRAEKNWIPYPTNDLLFFVYSFIPSIIYQFNGGELKLVCCGQEQPDAFFSMRGGTQFIPWRDGLLGVVHDSPVVLDRIYYRHKFVHLDKNLNLLEIGEPFFIQKRGIEFACGLTIFEGRIFMSYGLSDRYAALCELPEEVIDRWIIA